MPLHLIHARIWELRAVQSISTHSRIRNIQHQDIRRPHLRKPIHHSRNTLLINHRADRYPAFLFKGRDSRCAAARRDLRRVVKRGALDVVLAEDVFLGSWWGELGAVEASVVY